MDERNCENCAREDCAFIPPAGEVHCEYWHSDAPAVNRWIPCAERLPEIDKDVLVFYPYWNSAPIQVAHLNYDGLTFELSDGEFNLAVKSVTHWMPLPDAPEVNSDAD